MNADKWFYDGRSYHKYLCANATEDELFAPASSVRRWTWNGTSTGWRGVHFAGLPYGSVDLDYLIGVLDLVKKDGQLSVVLPMKALRAVDHFLLARFFDYQQVAFHKTVTGFEQLFEEAILYLLKKNRMACRKEDIDAKIRSEEWIRFDDEALLGMMRAEQEEAKEEETVEAERFLRVTESILDRRPPRLIGEVGLMAEEADELARAFATKVDEASEEIKALTDMEPRFVRWSYDGMRLTKIGADTKLGGRDRQAADQLAHIRHKSGKLVPLIDEPRSVMRAMSAQKWYCARFYALDAGREQVREWRQSAQAILSRAFGNDPVSELTRP